MKICVYGLWHLGLVTLTGLARIGKHCIVGLDDVSGVEHLCEGRLPVHEIGVPETLRAMLLTKRIELTNDPKVALDGADVIWVTFDTPINNKDRPDADYIENKIMGISNYIPDKARLIISSQVPVGFTEKISILLSRKHPDKKVYVAYSPENLKLGNALERFIHPDRIVIGTHLSEKKYFEPIFGSISDHLCWMSIPSAEMTKHAINTFLAMSISFANEIARICDQTGASSTDVEIGLRTDERVGFKSYTRAGDAYSGGTLSRDVTTLNDIIVNTNTVAPVISAIPSSNEHHKSWIRHKTLAAMNFRISGNPVAVFGLTYKGGTSTLRRSGALEFCEWLHDNGALIFAYDPLVSPGDVELPRYINMMKDVNQLLDYALYVVILQDMHILLDAEKSDKLRRKIVIDPNGYLHSEFKDTSKYFSVRS